MSVSRFTSHRSKTAFTLIELLVVVAIIALLISILLPSLSKARAQARTTICMSRIVQIAKGFLIYSDDYQETPPFICWGRGSDDSDPPSPFAGDLVYDQENWLTAPAELQIVWNGNEDDDDWPSNWLNKGWLFSYARFEALYRCPEFERITDPLCQQHEFNYSRSILGRKGTINVDDIGTSDGPTPYGIGFNGPIVKPSMAYAPSKLSLVVDEDWLGYVGYPVPYPVSWSGCDPIMDIVDSYIGPYHGQPVLGAVYDDGWEVEKGRKRGSVAMYDGHVELVRDGLPAVNGGSSGRPMPSLVIPEVLKAYMDMVGEVFYAQQGMPFSDIF